MSLNKKINKALIPLDTPSQEVNNISNLKSNSNNKRLTGFTLLEILLVIGIISILAGIAIIAINPARQLAQVRNTERKSDIKQLYNALNQYYIDNGHYPNTLLTSLTEICDTANATSTHSIDCTNLVDLSSLVPTYLTAIPTDPKTTSTNTGYEIIKNTYGKIGVSATAELDQTVTMGSVTNPWTCGDTLVDVRDSQEYATVLIGSQCWMQENINAGIMVTGATTMTNTGTIEKYCYNNNEANCTTDGGLYIWSETMNYSNSCNGTGASQPACTNPVQGICPVGWHIPSHYEWTLLERTVCTSVSCATDFPYDTTTTVWRGTNEGATFKDMLGSFRAILAGSRWTNFSFNDRSTHATFWSSSAFDGSSSWIRSLYYGLSTINRDGTPIDYGFSVRCLKN